MVVNVGTVGTVGRSHTVAPEAQETADQVHELLTSQQVEARLAEVDQDQMQWVVVQFAIPAQGPTDSDWDRLEATSMRMTEALCWTGNGYCDGHNVGSGTINVSGSVINATAAASTMRSDLADHDLDDDIVVAVRGARPTDEYIAVWPADHCAFRLA